MKITAHVLLAALGLAILTPAFAEDAAAPKVPSDVSVLAYGAAHPECLEWTDSCRTCTRSPDGRVACSTPGIACTPKQVVCKEERKK